MEEVVLDLATGEFEVKMKFDVDGISSLAGRILNAENEITPKTSCSS